MEPARIARDLQLLEVELKRLEVEYNMFFAGARHKPPWELRARVEALLRQYDREPPGNTAERFRFGTLQQRYQTLAELWERGMKALESGRPLFAGAAPPPGGPSGVPGRDAPGRPASVEGRAEPAGEQVLNVTMITDPAGEMDKIQRLYETVVAARRQEGARTVPFHRFADMVRRQVENLQGDGHCDVAFRASIRDGKVHLTARPLRGVKNREPGAGN